MTAPTKGGRYLRDPDTGELTPQPKHNAPAAEAAVAETTEAPKAKPAQRKKET